MKRNLVGVACFFALALPLCAQVGGRATRPKVQRPDGEVWTVIRKNCTACHGIDDYAFYALDRDGWQKLLVSKHPGGEGSIAESDQKVLLDYLVGKFGPTAKPFPRTYVPPEITTFFSDPEAKRMLNRACTTCHDLARVETARHDEDAWRVLLVDMRERGAVVADDELERLVEWLGRVWGTNRDK
jgi:cytochrome c5